MRWNILLKQEDCQYPYWSSFAAFMSSFSIGLITPGRLGEIARLYYVRGEREISFFKSFKTIVVDRIFDFSLLFWFGLAGLLFYYKVLEEHSSIYYLLIAGLFLFIIWLTLSLLIIIFKTDKIYYQFIKDAWTNMFNKNMIVPWLLTLISYIISYMTSWFILISLDQSISLPEVGFIVSIMSLITLIPITIAGFGTREASLIYLLSFYGVAPETALIFSLMQFLAFFLWAGLVGLVFWLIKPMKLSLIRQDAVKLVTMLKKEKSV